MTTTETAYLAAFLHAFSERLGNDGCNDLYLANTEENRKFIEAVHEFHEQEEDIRLVDRGKGRPKQIVANNVAVVEFLLARLMDENDLEEDELPEIS
jgi:hypothetical protein